MATLNLRDVDETLIRALKVEAAKRGVSLKDLVVSTLEGLEYGDDEGAAKGSIGSDHGKVSADGGGKADIRVSDDGASVSPKRGQEGVRKVRGVVQGRSESEGGDCGAISGEVHGPSSGAQSESSAVGGGAQPDSVGEAVGYVGRYKHDKDCDCPKCIQHDPAATLAQHLRYKR